MNYVQRANPNLALMLQFLGKLLWILLAAFFGWIGMRLYTLGVTTTGSADASFFGVDMTLENAGPGLVVMVVALLCALVGAIRSRVIISDRIIELSAPTETSHTKPLAIHPVVISNADIDGPSNVENLERVWGLTEAAMIRVPIDVWASTNEQERIRNVQTSNPLPDNWAKQLLEIARLSAGFRAFLKALSSNDQSELTYIAGTESLSKIDFKLPWCTRMRWGARNYTHVDIFICGTGGNNRIAWTTIREEQRPHGNPVP